MIYYFSGTGNSAYIAKLLAQKLGDDVLSLNNNIKCSKQIDIPNERLIFITPVYAWRIPAILTSYLQTLQFHKGQSVYFIMTCGTDMGNAEQYAKPFCETIGVTLKGLAEVLMPENYIALFDAPDKTTTEKIIAIAEKRVTVLAKEIASGNDLQKKKINLLDILKSSIAHKFFFAYIVSAKKFYANSNCISCTLCVKKCPVNNITLENTLPVWGKTCTHCMACIAYCPTKAIEHGRSTRKKERYVCPKN